MIKINFAKTNSDYECIEQLANAIWREHYIPIIGIKQVNYMLDKFQSVYAIASQVESGYNYYILSYDENPVGYLSFIKEKKALFLSKIYILKEFRGNKIGKSAMLFIEDKAKEMNCNSIMLTVNKNNVFSISAYKKLGFLNTGAIVKDIGNGFVMDDYKMEKLL